MSVYTVLRLVHSYWRWAVLVAALVVFARAVAGLVSSRAWTASDQRAGRLFITTLDVQFVLGIVLYFGFSPFWMSTIQSFRETMQAPVARFFGVEHETAMVLAMAAVHVGWARAARAADPRRKYRTLLVTLLVFFAISAWAIPWPGRVVGRPLFRTTF